MYITSSNTVKLLHARSPEYNPCSAFFAEGYLAVQNPDGAKNIYVHYTYDNVLWNTVSASPRRVVYGIYDVWYFRTPPTYSSSCCCFTIDSCFDESYGKNIGSSCYSLRWYSPTIILAESVLNLHSIIIVDGTFTGRVVVKNLVYDKLVTVRYTTDDWVTCKEEAAFFSQCLSDDLEIWDYKITVPCGSSLKFAIYCLMNGITYWDNNFTDNYSYSIP
ncbi:MAG: CBM21 domain-containing protein [Clostridia bacterium]|nr:CBM21 domain-containing protein [Clostridia bacterium]